MQRVTESGCVGAAAHDVMSAARRQLVEHTAREERDLYARLNSAATGNPALRTTLAIFTRDLASLNETVMEFFDTYLEGGDEKTFKADFTAMTEALQARIRREETILFKELDGLAA